jgi:hypothetical protein
MVANKAVVEKTVVKKPMDWSVLDHPADDLRSMPEDQLTDAILKVLADADKPLKGVEITRAIVSEMYQRVCHGGEPSAVNRILPALLKKKLVEQRKHNNCSYYARIDDS